MERFFHFDENVLNLVNDAYLDGYWQSERYFSDIVEQIRELFTVRKISHATLDMADRIRTDRSVSLHVRRGDYTYDENASQVFEVIPVRYYTEAIQYLEDRIDPFEIFLFRDDPAWARQNLSLSGKITFVEGFSDVEDMWLMSRCDHNIIANSSFSWWVGWLNDNADKIVLAPTLWFKSGERDTKDLISDKWTKIQTGNFAN